MWYSSLARNEGVAEATMQYLQWDVGLLEKIRPKAYNFRFTEAVGDEPWRSELGQCAFELIE